MALTAALTASYIGGNAGTNFSIYYDSFCTGSNFVTGSGGSKEIFTKAELLAGVDVTFPDFSNAAYVKIESSGTQNPFCIQCFGPVNIPGGGVPSPSVSPTPSISLTPTPSVTSVTPTPSASPVSRAITFSLAVGASAISDACDVTTGQTKYIALGQAISNGLVIYDDASLTTRTFSSDPGLYGWLQDPDDSNQEYGLDFDSNGTVSVIYTC